jgi:hypothetical protein
MKTKIKSSMLASSGKNILFDQIFAFHSSPYDSPLRIGRPRLPPLATRSTLRIQFMFLSTPVGSSI